MFGNDDKKLVINLQSEIKSLRGTNSTLMQRVDEQATTLETLAFKLEEYKGKVAGHDAVVAKLVTAHEKKVNDVTTSINKQVNAHLASIGVTKFARENFVLNEADKTGAELAEKYASLPKEEQYAFYQKHKDKLSKALLHK